MTSAGTTREVPRPNCVSWPSPTTAHGRRSKLRTAPSRMLRLRAAVRNDRARLGEIEIEVEEPPAPTGHPGPCRRAGASAEEVAAVRRHPGSTGYAGSGPARAFMAERARSSTDAAPGEHRPQLGEAVAERLLLRGADKDSVQWDSWRRDDGTWEVLLVLPGSRPSRTRRAGPTTRPGGSSRPSTTRRGRGLGETDDTPAELPLRARIALVDRALDRQSQDRDGDRDRTGGEDDEQVRGNGSGERDSLTSLLEAVPSFRGDMVVPEAPKVPQQEERPRRRSWRSRPLRRRARARARPTPMWAMRRAVAGHRDLSDGHHRPPGRGRRRPAGAPGRRAELGTRSSLGRGARKLNETSGRAAKPGRKAFPRRQPGWAPVATGVADHSLQEPTYSAAGTPATASAILRGGDARTAETRPRLGAAPRAEKRPASSAGGATVGGEVLGRRRGQRAGKCPATRLDGLHLAAVALTGPRVQEDAPPSSAVSSSAPGAAASRDLRGQRRCAPRLVQAAASRRPGRVPRRARCSAASTAGRRPPLGAVVDDDRTVRGTGAAHGLGEGVEVCSRPMGGRPRARRVRRPCPRRPRRYAPGLVLGTAGRAAGAGSGYLRGTGASGTPIRPARGGRG
ncbi:hypothetical protein SRIMM317S_03776 [Streptomyces rimosus subsp. rimosus]